MERTKFITQELSLPLDEVIKEIGGVMTDIEPELNAIEKAGINQLVQYVDFTLEMQRITDDALLDELTERFKAGQLSLNKIVSHITAHI